MNLFPDGGVYSTYLEKVIWTSHYANPELLKIGVRKKDIEFTQKIFEANKKAIPLICNNHVVMYEFAKKVVRGKTIVYNIDFHHDNYDNSIQNRDSEKGNISNLNSGRIKLIKKQLIIW